MVHFKTFLKTFFIVLLVFLVLELGFWGYVRYFNKDLGEKIANLIHKTEIKTEIPNVQLGENELKDQIQLLSAQLTAIQDNMNQISNDIQNIEIKNENTVEVPVSNGQSTVKLYYFNNIQDQKLDPEQQLNTNSILPVERKISSSNNLIKDTVDLLLEGELTDEEVNLGYTSSFPNSKFYLKNLTLDSDGTLTLQFTEVAGFTSGGSAQQLLLKSSIEKTVKQFPEVKKVKFLPETLFQP